MSKVVNNSADQKFLAAVLSLSLTYNFIYNTGILFSQFSIKDFCDYELVKFTISNFIMSYLAVFVLFFGLSINKRLLYCSTIILFLLSLLSSKYFVSAEKKILLHKISSNYNIYIEQSHIWFFAILLILLGWYLVYYFSNVKFQINFLTKIIMLLCLLLCISKFLFIEQDHETKYYPDILIRLAKQAIIDYRALGF